MQSRPMTISSSTGNLGGGNDNRKHLLRTGVRTPGRHRTPWRKTTDEGAHHPARSRNVEDSGVRLSGVHERDMQATSQDELRRTRRDDGGHRMGSVGLLDEWFRRIPEGAPRRPRNASRHMERGAYMAIVLLTTCKICKEKYIVCRVYSIFQDPYRKNI